VAGAGGHAFPSGERAVGDGVDHGGLVVALVDPPGVKELRDEATAVRASILGGSPTSRSRTIPIFLACAALAIDPAESAPRLRDHS
jgi:hypothetical protein